MKAVAVTPGKAGSIHLEEVPKPSVADIPEGRGLLARVLRVGVDDTDKEINAADYGAPLGGRRLPDHRPRDRGRDAIKVYVEVDGA